MCLPGGKGDSVAVNWEFKLWYKGVAWPEPHLSTWAAVRCCCVLVGPTRSHEASRKGGRSGGCDLIKKAVFVLCAFLEAREVRWL